MSKHYNGRGGSAGFSQRSGNTTKHYDANGRPRGFTQK
jgi:hypothetical protein